MLAFSLNGKRGQRFRTLGHVSRGKNLCVFTKAWQHSLVSSLTFMGLRRDFYIPPPPLVCVKHIYENSEAMWTSPQPPALVTAPKGL